MSFCVAPPQASIEMQVVCEYLCKKAPVSLRDFTGDARFIIIHSFNVNKSRCEIEELQGGVVGGSILRGASLTTSRNCSVLPHLGVLRVGQEIEVRPGLVKKAEDGRVVCQPIFSRILSLHAENNRLQVRGDL